MNSLNLTDVRKYVNNSIVNFHCQRVKSLEGLTLGKLLKKNPYLFKAKNLENVQPVLGICYGKTKTSYVRGYLKVAGQNFWYLISENKALYTEIIEPIGHQAGKHNENFLEGKTRVSNILVKQLVDEFCTPDGAINWAAIVEFNSGNYDLDKFL